jgi:death-on-curing protein
LLPTIDKVIAVHARLIARFGGSLGIRDRGAIESGLARPQSGYYAEIIQEAASLWEGLSQNHPFIDAKRVALTVMPAFLRVNGHRIEFDGLEASHFSSGSMKLVHFDSRNWRAGCGGILFLAVPHNARSGSYVSLQ